MNARSATLRVCLLAAFAWAVGDFAFRTWRAPVVAEHRVGGLVTPLSAPTASADKKHLYLRHTWTMTRAPVSAWIEVLGHDAFEIYVNGRRMNRGERVGRGRIAAAVTDITRFLTAGENTLAIHAAQMIIDRPPEIAVRGGANFADGTSISFGDPAEWLASDVYDRRGGYWYEPGFVDDHWAAPTVGEQVVWKAQTHVPPGAISRPRDSQWVTSRDQGGAAVFSRAVRLDAAPREAWMRLLATGPFRLAVNGSIVVRDDATLALRLRRKPTEYTTEIGPYLRAGDNVVSVAVSDAGEAARIRADLEATLPGGELVYVPTDSSWSAAAGQVVDWMRPEAASEHWSPCREERGFQGVPPRSIVRRLLPPTPAIGFSVERFVAYVLTVAAVGLLGFFGCRWTARASAAAARGGGESLPGSLPYAALAAPALLAATGALMTWDVAWTSSEVYTPRWLTTLALLAPVQWLTLVALSGGRSRRTAPATTAPERRRALMIVGWCVVMLAGLWLRLVDLTTEPIHHDEVTSYMFTMSIFQHGFPGGQVHPEIPFGYCATSELSFYPNALCALFTDDPLLVIRVPSVVWSMATLVLLGYVATRWFNATAGLVAGALFAVAPQAIVMANFGRYLAEVQFFMLLSMYLAYEAVKGDGPVRVGRLWGATLAFIAMYLSWEGTGIFGVGLAVATLLERRGRLRSVIGCPSFYFATLLVVVVAVAQNSHRVYQQTQRLWYGEGISSLTLKPMWRYPFFDVDFYLINSSWTKDALLPMLAVAAACVLAAAHRWRYPIRFSLISLAANAGLMSSLLPLRSNRYSYHLSAIVLLLTAAVLAAMAESVARSAVGTRLRAFRLYARGVAALIVCVGVVLASGWSVRTSELRSFSTAAQGPKQLRIPDWIGPTQFLKENFREGDVIVSIFPHAQNFVFEQLNPGAEDNPRADYWLESRLIIQATLGDERDVPLDRRSGATMLYDLDQIEQLFAEHDRVWYCTMRYAQSRINESEVSRYLREHMDVVHEDFATAVLLRDKNHRPAPIRLDELEAGRLASEYYLD